MKTQVTVVAASSSMAHAAFRRAAGRLCRDRRFGAAGEAMLVFRDDPSMFFPSALFGSACSPSS
jgi:hypothetical protein